MGWTCWRERWSHRVADVATDEPEAYIARDRRRALADRVEMPDRVDGSALFADISGFTPLTEALANELGPQRGAEELTANLGRVFHAVIAELDRHGGNVIYFSGDAITCWIDGDDGLRAVAVAFAMQEAMAREGEITTPGGTVVRLALKVAVATGRARRFVVGDPDIQLIDVLAGRLIDDLAEAEHHADKGEVVLDRSAVEALGDRVVLGEVRTDDEGHGAWSVAVGADRAARAGAGSRTRAARRRARPAVAAARRLRADALGSRRVPGRAPAGLPGLPALRRHRLRRRRRRHRQARRLRAPGAADHGRLRRQRPAADPRRQGRLPVRRVRLAGRPRGRRRPGGRGGPRAARPGALDRGAGHPDRADPRSAPERHVRPRDAAHVRVPRRRGEPRRAADVGGAGRPDLRRRPAPPGGRRRVHLGAARRTCRSRARRAPSSPTR